MIQASHATTVAVEASRAAHEAYLLAKEAAAAPAKPKPAKQAIPAKPKQPPKAPKPKPSKPKPTAKEPDVPEGWTLLDPPTAKAVRRLMQSHPQTRSF